jgi:hypothetical protein
MVPICPPVGDCRSVHVTWFLRFGNVSSVEISICHVQTMRSRECHGPARCSSDFGTSEPVGDGECAPDGRSAPHTGSYGFRCFPPPVLWEPLPFEPDCVLLLESLDVSGFRWRPPDAVVDVVPPSRLSAVVSLAR